LWPHERFSESWWGRQFHEFFNSVTAAFENLFMYQLPALGHHFMTVLAAFKNPKPIGFELGKTSGF
jgi:hypothetical protein